MSLYVFMPGMNAESSVWCNKGGQPLELAALGLDPFCPLHISQQQGNKVQITSHRYLLLQPAEDPAMTAHSSAFS